MRKKKQEKWRGSIQRPRALCMLLECKQPWALTPFNGPKKRLKRSFQGLWPTTRAQSSKILEFPARDPAPTDYTRRPPTPFHDFTSVCHVLADLRLWEFKIPNIIENSQQKEGSGTLNPGSITSLELVREAIIQDTACSRINFECSSLLGPSNFVYIG